MLEVVSYVQGIVLVPGHEVKIGKGTVRSGLFAPRFFP